MVVNKIGFVPNITAIHNTKRKSDNISQNFPQQQLAKSINPQLNLIYFTGRAPKLPFIEQLPKEIQQNRKGLIEDAIKYIRSSEFYEEKIACKNWKNSYFVDEMTALINNPQALRWRADMLTLKTRSALQSNFAGKILSQFHGQADVTVHQFLQILLRSSPIKNSSF